MDPGLLLDLTQYKRRVFHIPEGTGPVCPILGDTITVHHPFKIQKDPLYLGDMCETDPAVIIGIRPQVDQMDDVVNLPDAVLFGQLKNLEFHLMASDIDCTE